MLMLKNKVLLYSRVKQMRGMLSGAREWSVEQRIQVQGPCGDPHPSHARDSPEPGAGAPVWAAHHQGRDEHRRKEKKTEP